MIYYKLALLNKMDNYVNRNIIYITLISYKTWLFCGEKCACLVWDNIIIPINK